MLTLTRVSDEDHSMLTKSARAAISHRSICQLLQLSIAPMSSAPSQYPYELVEHSLDHKGFVVDAQYPGTAVARLTNVVRRVASLEPAELNGDWAAVRSRLLWAGGLKEQRSTSHAFNDSNHCDLTTMRSEVSYESNEDGAVRGISRRNLLGPHIEDASLAELGEGGSWSTCTNGCNTEPPLVRRARC